MGLDMYLEAERCTEDVRTVLATAGVDRIREDAPAYLGRWTDDEERHRADAVLSLAGLTPLVTPEDSNHVQLRSVEGGVGVSVTVIYWRKANAIHSWFVDNVQGGLDDCDRYEVHVEQLAHLRSMCAGAHAAYLAGDLAKARDILSPRDGFFFGSTKIDEWWASDVERTIAAIDSLIVTAIDAHNVRFFYQSSW